jgi:adenylate kinase
LATAYVMVMAGGYLSLARSAAGQANMMVFLSGLSGVGKTTTARAFVARHPQFRHIIASDLIRRTGAGIEPAEDDHVERNQVILLREFAAVRRRFPYHHFLLDGHMVIEIRKGDHIIADSVIDGLAVTHFVVIVDDPSRIYSTRFAVQGDSLSPSGLERLQNLEITTTRRQAERTGCPFVQVQSGQIKSLEDSLGLAN